MGIAHRLTEPARRATNVTISAELLTKAKDLGINISRASEVGISQAVAVKMKDQWLQENREAMESSNTFVERNGLPLAKYRQF